MTITAVTLNGTATSLTDAAMDGFRSSVRGAMDMRVSTQFGGKGVYWNEPDGHQWEMLTVSYARQPD